jgi:hypothetical protein
LGSDLSFALRDPLAAGHSQACLAPDQEAEHHQQAPHRKEKQCQDAGLFRVGSQQPCDEADGREQPPKSDDRRG